jgi:hypothetical protein
MCWWEILSYLHKKTYLMRYTEGVMGEVTGSVNALLQT